MKFYNKGYLSEKSAIKRAKNITAEYTKILQGIPDVEFSNMAMRIIGDLEREYKRHKASLGHGRQPLCPVILHNVLRRFSGLVNDDFADFLMENCQKALIRELQDELNPRDKKDSVISNVIQSAEERCANSVKMTTETKKPSNRQPIEIAKKPISEIGKGAPPVDLKK